MFQFWGMRENENKLQDVLTFCITSGPPGLAAISANRATCRLVNAMVMTLLIRKYHGQFFLTVLLTKTLLNILAMSFEHLNYS